MAKLIKTAPRDRDILLWNDGWHIGHWFDDGVYRGWYDENENQLHPTHWQELPPRPGSQSESTAEGRLAKLLAACEQAYSEMRHDHDRTAFEILEDAIDNV